MIDTNHQRLSGTWGSIGVGGDGTCIERAGDTQEPASTRPQGSLRIVEPKVVVISESLQHRITRLTRRFANSIAEALLAVS